MPKFIILLLSVLLFLNSGKSQSQFVAGVFPTIDHSGDITNKLGYGLYYFGAFPIVNLSKPNIQKDANFLLFYAEQSLTYKITERFSLTGSYVYQRANVIYDNYVNENRFYFQGTYKQALQKFSIKHRLRFDGRFIQNRFDNSAPFTHRLRYLIGFDSPLKTKRDNLYLTMYEEAFFSTVSKANPIYSENWASMALGINLNKRNKLELGLLYIAWNTGRNNWFNQLYLQCTWVSHLDLRKSKS